jgi:two-component system OmpR family sensor kinase
MRVVRLPLPWLARGAADWPDVTWIALWLAGVAGIVVFERWAAIPFHLIWVAFAIQYTVRVRRTRTTYPILAAVIITTGAALTMDVLRGTQPVDELGEVPLMAAMFWLLMWHGRRRVAADAERDRVSAENERLLATQRQFVQDASHQLKTPITIALGHAELLARSLAADPDRRDIRVIVGELNRLRVLSDRLLLIAAAENPDFLRPEPVALDRFAAEMLHRWRPTADRRWQLGRLDPVVVRADTERLSLAIDALLDNAVRHTRPGDLIRIGVHAGGRGGSGGPPPGGNGMVRLVVEDHGSGIPPAELAGIFDRFATGTRPGRRGTGLGLALVRAVAHGHGGEVTARSTVGQGTAFDLALPAPTTELPLLHAAARLAANHDGG